MSSAITFRDQTIWGSNGAIEEILQQLIRYAPDDSALLSWALEQYREFFPGICCDLTPVLTCPEAVAQWQHAITRALDAIALAGNWTPQGQAWLVAQREPLIQIAGAFGTIVSSGPESLPPGGPRPWLAIQARCWIEAVLLPLALEAAALPKDTDPASLEPIEPGLPERNSDTESRAWSFCTELTLLGAVAMADALAADEDSRLLCRRIVGLIWRAALERVQARDLAFDTNLPGIDNREFEAAYEVADVAWERWVAIDARLGPELLSFANLCADGLFDLPA